MARLIGGFFLSLLLCTVFWAQASPGTQRSSATENSSKPEAKEAAKPVGAEAEPDSKTTNAKEIAPPAKIRFTAVERFVSPSESAFFFAEPSCDGNGNLYLGPGNNGDAIRKINSKAELVASFKPEANPEIEVYGVMRYTVTPDGELYVPVGSNATRDWRFLVFKSDGSYSTNIRPDTGFSVAPANLAVFANGNILMTGTKLDRNSKMFIIPFTGIFRSDGKLLKEVTLEQDERLPDTSAMRNLQPGQAVPVITNRTVEWSQAEPAKDGNIYIMRWASPADFYAVSPGGEVVKRFKVDPGADYYNPEQMHIAGNRIAVMFWHTGNDRIMKIVDLDGQELATYEITPPTDMSKLEPIGVFACYTLGPERFTFLGNDKDLKLTVKQVEAR
jgi:hypothetical protein